MDRLTQFPLSSSHASQASLRALAEAKGSTVKQRSASTRSRPPSCIILSIQEIHQFRLFSLPQTQLRLPRLSFLPLRIHCSTSFVPETQVDRRLISQTDSPFSAGSLPCRSLTIWRSERHHSTDQSKIHS